jgi:hypothetical protein
VHGNLGMMWKEVYINMLIQHMFRPNKSTKNLSHDKQPQVGESNQDLLNTKEDC